MRAGAEQAEGVSERAIPPPPTPLCRAAQCACKALTCHSVVGSAACVHASSWSLPGRPPTAARNPPHYTRRAWASVCACKEKWRQRGFCDGQRCRTLSMSASSCLGAQGDGAVHGGHRRGLRRLGPIPAHDGDPGRVGRCVCHMHGHSCMRPACVLRSRQLRCAMAMRRGRWRGGGMDGTILNDAVQQLPLKARDMSWLVSPLCGAPCMRALRLGSAARGGGGGAGRPLRKALLARCHHGSC